MPKIEELARQHAKTLAERLKVHYGLHLDPNRTRHLEAELTNWLLGEGPTAPAPQQPPDYETVRYECGCEMQGLVGTKAYYPDGRKRSGAASEFCMRHGSPMIRQYAGYALPEPEPEPAVKENPDA